VAIDMYKGRVNPEVSNKNSVAMMRFLSGLFILCSFLIARNDFAFIVTLMSLSWGAVAGSFMAPYVYGLFWKRVTAAGAYAGMLTGLVTAVGLFFLLGPAKAPLSASLAMIVPFAVVPLVSWFTRPPSAALVAKAFEKI
jgi:SSS family solute:Na+ symporter